MNMSINMLGPFFVTDRFLQALNDAPPGTTLEGTLVSADQSRTLVPGDYRPMSTSTIVLGRFNYFANDWHKAFAWNDQQVLDLVNSHNPNPFVRDLAQRIQLRKTKGITHG